MSRPVIDDALLGRVERNPETGAWEAAWEMAAGHPVDVVVYHDGEADAVPERVRRLLLTLKEKDESIRREIAGRLIQLCNEDWNPDEQLTEEEFAGRLKLEGVVVSSDEDDAELFYDDDDIFAGHAVSAFMNSDGRISDPNLAG